MEGKDNKGKELNDRKHMDVNDSTCNKNDNNDIKNDLYENHSEDVHMNSINPQHQLPSYKLIHQLPCMINESMNEEQSFQSQTFLSVPIYIVNNQQPIQSIQNR